MEIIFYNNTSDCKVVNKSLTEVVTLSGNLRSKINVRTPQIDVEYSEELLTCNYCYIELFKRYYYIDSISVEYTGIATINLTCDVLMSFKDEILKSTGHFVRSENFNEYNADFPITDKLNIRKFEFSQMYQSKPTLLLVTVKGVRV